MAVRDKLVAAVSSAGSTSLNLYNVSKGIGRAPALVHYVPLDLGGKRQPIEVHLAKKQRGGTQFKKQNKNNKLQNAPFLQAYANI